MKAAIVEKPNVLAVRDIPEPPVGEYDAFCELLYGATCTGTDSHIIAGVFPFSSPFPTVLGHESVGRVLKVGPKVRNYRVGDLVTRVGTVPPPGASFTVTWGGFAEFGIAKDHWAMRADGRPSSAWESSRMNQIVPPGVDPATAPMFTTWRETLSFVTRLGVGPGTKILVAGSGGNGLSFAAHAVNRGAARVVMVGSARTEPSARQMGVTEYYDYRRPDLDEVLKSTAGEGFEVLLDAVGKQGLIDRFLPLLAPGGKVAIYGMDDFGRISVTPSRVRGTFILWQGGYDEAETHQPVSEYVLGGRLRAEPWYDPTRPFPLSEINEAFRAVRDRQSVKALVRLRET